MSNAPKALAGAPAQGVEAPRKEAGPTEEEMQAMWAGFQADATPGERAWARTVWRNIDRRVREVREVDTSGEAAKVADYKSMAELLRAKVESLEAARIAYASEFPLNEEGLPDVGSIHENIRALKAKLRALSEIMHRIEMYKMPEPGWALVPVTLMDIYAIAKAALHPTPQADHGMREAGAAPREGGVEA